MAWGKLIPAIGTTAGEIPQDGKAVPVVGLIIPDEDGAELELYMELPTAQSLLVDLNAAVQSSIQRQAKLRKSQLDKRNG
jgi:hypothetical protein